MLSQKEYTKIIYLIAIIAALGGLLFGLDQGFIAIALKNVTDVYHISIYQQEVYTSIMATGGVIGSLCSGFVNKFLGRKNALIFAGFIFTLMSLVSACLPSFEILKLARFFLGFAVGIASFSVPLYLAETSPKQIRGKVGTLFQLMISTGVFIVVVANYLIAKLITQAELSLSVMFIFLLVFSFLMFSLCFFLPKSPKWLISKGKEAQARVILSKIWKDNKNIDEEIANFKTTIAQTVKEPLYKLIFEKFFLKVLLIGILLQMFQQLVGICFILYYAPTTLGYVGLNGISGLLILYFIHMIATFPAMKLTDKWGRKKLLYIGSIIMFITMICASISFYKLDQATTLSGFEISFFKILLLTSFTIHLMAFSTSWGPVVWIMCSEIFPFKSKEVGMTITTMVNWTFVGFVSFTSLSIMKYFGNFAAPLMFASFCILSLIILKFLIPETKQVSLEKIESNLINGYKLRDLGKIN